MEAGLKSMKGCLSAWCICIGKLGMKPILGSNSPTGRHRQISHLADELQKHWTSKRVFAATTFMRKCQISSLCVGKKNNIDVEKL